MNFKSIKLLIALTLINVTFTSCAQDGAKKNSNNSETEFAQSSPTVELINPTDLNAKLGDIQLIDVRTPKEFNNGHIVDAVNINYYDKDFMDQMYKLDKNKEIYIYCRSGSRSSYAASKLKKQGFTKIYDLQGGILNWNREKLETVK